MIRPALAPLYLVLFSMFGILLLPVYPLVFVIGFVLYFALMLMGLLASLAYAIKFAMIALVIVLVYTQTVGAADWFMRGFGLLVQTSKQRRCRHDFVLHLDTHAMCSKCSMLTNSYHKCRSCKLCLCDNCHSALQQPLPSLVSTATQLNDSLACLPSETYCVIELNEEDGFTSFAHFSQQVFDLAVEYESSWKCTFTGSRVINAEPGTAIPMHDDAVLITAYLIDPVNQIGMGLLVLDKLAWIDITSSLPRQDRQYVMFATERALGAPQHCHCTTNSSSTMMVSVQLCGKPATTLTVPRTIALLSAVSILLGTAIWLSNRHQREQKRVKYL